MAGISAVNQPSRADTDPCASIIEQLRSQGIWDDCSKSSIFYPKKKKPADPEPPAEVVMNYEPIARTVADVPRCQIKPSLQTFSRADPLFSKILTKFPSSAGGHDIVNPTIDGISFIEPNWQGGFGGARIEGHLTIEKKWYYKYPCVEDWTLRWCDGWTLAYSFGAGWSAIIRPLAIPYLSANIQDPDYVHVSLPGGHIGVNVGPHPSEASPFRSPQSGFFVDVPNGSADFQLDVSNDLVRIVEDLVRVFGEYLHVLDSEFLGLLKLNYDQFRKFDLETLAENGAKDVGYSEEVQFIRNILNEQVGDFQDRHYRSKGKSQSLALTSILNSFRGDSADFRTTTFTGAPGRWAQVGYSIRNEDLLDRVFSGVQTDPLGPRQFCALTKANMASELKQMLEGEKDTAVEASPFPWLKYENEGKALFQKSDLSRSIQSFRLSANLRDDDAVSRLGILNFFRGRIVARNFSTYSDLVRFYNLSLSERACARRRVLSISRQLKRVYPGEDITDCVGAGANLTEPQTAVLSSVDALLTSNNFWQTHNDTEALAPPLTKPQLRGWFYCHEQPSVCGSDAKNVIRWDPDQSVFEGRAVNRNSGFDVFSAEHVNGASPIAAVADGPIFFKKVENWGNVLILPFVNSGREFFAVYGGLPDSAAGFDGKTVRKGDSLGTTGCSVHTNNLCNAYCKIGELFHTDQHLHFEIIARSGPQNFKPANPTDVLSDWAPSRDPNGVGNKVCTECKDTNCFPTKVRAVRDEPIGKARLLRARLAGRRG